MTSEEEKSLQRFETRIRQMLLSYQTLQKEYLSLQEQYNLEKQKHQETQQTLEKVKEDFLKFKTAKIIALSNEDINLTKKRLKELVKKVDQCIALIKI